MTELEEHEAFIAEVDALRRLRTVAEMVVLLDAPPRDEERWDSIMTILRRTLDECRA